MKRVVKVTLVGAGAAAAVTAGLFLIRRIRSNRHG